MTFESGVSYFYFMKNIGVITQILSSNMRSDNIYIDTSFKEKDYTINLKG